MGEASSVRKECETSRCVKQVVYVKNVRLNVPLPVGEASNVRKGEASSVRETSRWVKQVVYVKNVRLPGG